MVPVWFSFSAFPAQTFTFRGIYSPIFFNVFPLNFTLLRIFYLFRIIYPLRVSFFRENLFLRYSSPSERIIYRNFLFPRAPLQIIFFPQIYFHSNYFLPYQSFLLKYIFPPKVLYPSLLFSTLKKIIRQKISPFWVPLYKVIYSSTDFSLGTCFSCKLHF